MKRSRVNRFFGSREAYRTVVPNVRLRGTKFTSPFQLLDISYVNYTRRRRTREQLDYPRVRFGRIQRSYRMFNRGDERKLAASWTDFRFTVPIRPPVLGSDYPKERVEKRRGRSTVVPGVFDVLQANAPPRWPPVVYSQKRRSGRRTAETYSDRGNKSLPGKKPIRDYRNDLFVFLRTEGRRARKPTFRTPATYVRPNLFASRATPLDGQRALFTLVITPRPVPRRWLASHKLSSAKLSLFRRRRRRRRQPNRPGSLNAFYQTPSSSSSSSSSSAVALLASSSSASVPLLKVIG